MWCPPISITFCGQNMCRILIKIWPEYCSIFHGEYSRLARNFAHTSSLGIGLSVHLNQVEAQHNINTLHLRIGRTWHCWVHLCLSVINDDIITASMTVE